MPGLARHRKQAAGQFGVAEVKALQLQVTFDEQRNVMLSDVGFAEVQSCQLRPVWTYEQRYI